MKFFDRLRKQTQSDEDNPRIMWELRFQKISPVDPGLTLLEWQQLKAIRAALAHLDPVLASDDLSECHHRMALAASELRKVLEDTSEKKP